MSVSEHPLTRISRLARPHTGRLLLGIVLGALAIAAGIGLMATAGYLISRAAQQPPILELSVAIVGVRFFGVSRGVLRYLERVVSHDATLRAIATVRVRLFARLEPLVPAGLPGVRTGDLLGRFVADVDALQNLYLRAFGPAAVALLAGGVAVAVALVRLPGGRPRARALPRGRRRRRAARGRRVHARRRAPRGAGAGGAHGGAAGRPGRRARARRLRRCDRGRRARRRRRRRARVGAPAHARWSLR